MAHKKLFINILSLFVIGCTVCTSVLGYVLPYKAVVERVDPTIPGLVIKGQADGLEISNNTGVDVELLDERSEPVVRITSTEIFEKKENLWIRTHASNTFYYYHPSIVYEGPYHNYQSEAVLKSWRLLGRVGNQSFTVMGTTRFVPNRSYLPLIEDIAAFVLAVCAIVGSLLVWQVFRVNRQNRST